MSKRAPRDMQGDLLAIAEREAPIIVGPKPTPDEVAKLRELYPQGSPRIDYREMTIDDPEDDPAQGGDGGADEEEEDGARSNAPLAIAISSEAPVLRYDWWSNADDPRYYEVLDHSPRSVVLDYARDGLPFIASHRSYDADQQHGLVENVRVEQKVLRGDVRFSRAQRSQDIAQDMRDGIRKKVSVGYIVGDQYDQTEKAKDGIPIRRYTVWMPLEVSTVPIPADYSVGVGRALSPDGQAAIARFLTLVKPNVVPGASQRAATVTSPAPKAKDGTMADNATAPGGASNDNAGGSSAAPSVSVGVDHSAARSAEAQRIANIRSFGQEHAIDADKISEWIFKGIPEGEVAKEALAIIGKRMNAPINTDHGPTLPAKDAKRFSMSRALMLGNDLERLFRMEHPGGNKVDFGLEREVLQETAYRAGGSQKGGNVLPYNLLGVHPDPRQSQQGRAGIDSSVASTGGAFKFTQPGEFIPLLRNKTSVIRAGSTVLTGLTGPVSFPKQLTAATAAWSAENPGSDISLTNLTTGLVTLAFKSVAAGTAFSRQMLFAAASGNYDIEGIIQGDLLAVLGLAIDLGGLNGLGSSNQPKGVLKNTSIGSVTLGSNGATATWDNWVDLETKIAQANADTSRMAYLTSAKQRGTAKKKAVLNNTASGTPIWTGPYSDGFDGIVNGYRALTSEQVPDNLTKGTSTTICSAIVFGAWEHNLIGMFGPGFEMVVDPYGKKFQGMIEVASWAYCDVAQRYDGAFAAIVDAL